MLSMDGAVSFLIAEDDALVGRVLVRALSRHGRAELVTTLEEARSALKTHSYSAVVVDMGLPDGSGLDVIADARANDPGVSALIVSGHVDQHRLAAAHHLGVAFLLKPVDTREIGVFAARTRSRTRARNERTAALVALWAVEYDLTAAEASLLDLAAHGAQRSRLHELRGVAPSTVKKQIQFLLNKTGDSSFEAAVSRLLRAVLEKS